MTTPSDVVAASSSSPSAAPMAGERLFVFPQPGMTEWQTAFLMLVGVLSSTILLKIASIQYMELLYLFQMCLLLVKFHERGYCVSILKPLLWLGALYAVFGVAVALLSVAALRFTFYLPGGDIPPLHRPVWITISRLVELTGNVTIMLLLAQVFSRSMGKARLLLRIYFWTGVASAFYSFLSAPFALLNHGMYGAYLTLGLRLRGFYNEGGPYGIYVVSVVLAGVCLVQRDWEPRFRVYLCFLPLGAALIGARSKAAIASIAIIFTLYLVLGGSLRRNAALFVPALVVLLVLSQTVDFGANIRKFQQFTAAYEKASLLRKNDGNFVMGRVAGGFIVPRMIAQHPLTGIGWGNYGFLRNAPEYRGAAAWVDAADDPGLGILGGAADFGLPLLAFILICLFLPFFYVRAVRAPAYLQIMALMQPAAHLAGAQLNLTYPWVLSACSMGIAFAQSRSPGNAKGIPGSGVPS